MLLSVSLLAEIPQGSCLLLWKICLMQGDEQSRIDITLYVDEVVYG